MYFYNENFIISTLNIESKDIENCEIIVIDNTVHFKVTLKNTHPTCPICGGDTQVKDYHLKTYHHLPVTTLSCDIDWNRRRFVCKDCGRSFSEHNPFGLERYHYTYAVLSEILLDLSNVNITFEYIAKKRNISKTIVQLYFDSFVIVPRISLPEYLGIDEIRSDMAKYGGKYLCVFVDNKNRCLNEILPNRSKNTLVKHFESIPLQERERVKFVTMDMWDTYREVSKRFLPNARICADNFHVVKNLTDGFSRIRIDLMNSAPKDSAKYYLLKKWHWLLESDINLDNQPKYNGYFKQKLNYRELYDMLLDINPALTLAYQLKEEYRRFNRNATISHAEETLNKIIPDFEGADLYCYRDFVGILHNWKQEIINSFYRDENDRKQSNALAENINGQIRTIINAANGYSNFDRFRARCLYCLNKSIFYALSDSVKSYKREGKSRGKYNKNKPVLTNDHSYEDLLNQDTKSDLEDDDDNED